MSNASIDDTANLSHPDRISKSKLKTYRTCQMKYYYKYIVGLPDDFNEEAKKRGTIVHETIEQYYENISTYVSNTGEYPTPVASFLPPKSSWKEYTHPYMTNFVAFEMSRLEECSNPSEFIPLGIEEWNQVELPYGRSWVGLADVILHPSSVPTVSDNVDAYILDFKTGESEAEQYRDSGVYLDGQYYSLLFNDEFESVESGGFYLGDDVFTTAPTSEEDFGALVSDALEAFSTLDKSQFSVDEGPLCCWGTDEDQRCPFYDECQSTWAAPVENSDLFASLVQDDLLDEEIASQLNCSEESVSYWRESLPVAPGL